MNWKLKVKIMEKFKTQWRFAQAIGKDSSLVSRVVTGATELAQNQKEEWAEALGCSSKELFSGTEERV